MNASTESITTPMDSDPIDGLFQCVPNFSEGRRPEIIEELAAAARSVPGVTLADYSADPDHNRSVFSLLGGAAPVRSAAIAMATVAVARIDLRSQTGVHPRIGALDVLPIVPLFGMDRSDAIDLADSIAEEIARSFDVPIYLYEWSVRTGRESRLPAIRAGGFEALRGMPLVGRRAPDFGPAAVHPSAGACVIGARGRLVAYNVNLETADLVIARSIAAQIRAERESVSALHGVRAMGVMLERAGIAQVSMNITQPDYTPLPPIYDWVESAARSRGATVRESEIIGMICRRDLGDGVPEQIRWRSARQTQVIETWIPEGRFGPTP